MTDLEKAFDKMTWHNRIESKDYDLPMSEFVVRLYNTCGSQTYGKQFVKKICYDSKYSLMEISQTEDNGDCTIERKLYFEFKVSYLPKSGKYSIRNIRGYQKFDYFVLCFIDENFKMEFYCVAKSVICESKILRLTPMNGTKASNIGNINIGYSTTVDKYDIGWLFSKHNILEGTTYGDLMKYISKNSTTQEVKHRNITNGRAMASRISYRIDGSDIKGLNNRDSLFNLVKHIGADKLVNTLWPSIVSNEEREGYYKLGERLYVNTRLSKRDTVKVVRRISENLNINIEINEE